MIRAEGLALAGRLEPLSLELKTNELVCLVGPNGSGKTSLLHAIAGVGGPDGRVSIDGIDPASAPPAARARLLSFLPASRDIAWPLTARDSIALGGATEEEIDAMIAALELERFAARRMDRLSTGERSRVLIARALAPSPALLLLDEPTANLDPLWRLRLMEMLQGRTAVVAMHDLDSAAAYADRLLVIEGGRIVADGPPEEVMTGPTIAAVFEIERANGKWRPLRSRERPRSSP